MNPQERRRLRFSLRTLLIVVLVLGVGFGWFVSKWREAERQRRVVEAVSKAHGWCYYDYAWDGGYIEGQEPLAPEWLMKLVGEDFFSDVVAVSVPYRKSVDDDFLYDLRGLTRLESLNVSGTQITDEGLRGLSGLTELKSLMLYDTHVTEEGIKELHKALPKCNIDTHTPPW